VCHEAWLRVLLLSSAVVVSGEAATILSPRITSVLRRCPDGKVYVDAFCSSSLVVVVAGPTVVVFVSLVFWRRVGLVLCVLSFFCGRRMVVSGGACMLGLRAGN
jgi:hypothetical protein